MKTRTIQQGTTAMIDDSTRDRLGRQLRAIYESTPKGGIPERIWVLLLLIEHDLGRKAQAAGAARAK